MPTTGKATMTTAHAILDAGSRCGLRMARMRTTASASPRAIVIVSCKGVIEGQCRTSDGACPDIRLAREPDQPKRAPAKEAAALPFVPQDVGAAALTIIAGLDVASVDPHANAVGDVLGFLLAPLKRRLDVAGAQPAVATDIDRRGSFDRHLQRLECVRWVGRHNRERPPVTIGSAPQGKRHSGALLDDLCRLIPVVAFPGDPH